MRSVGIVMLGKVVEDNFPFFRRNWLHALFLDHPFEKIMPSLACLALLRHQHLGMAASAVSIGDASTLSWIERAYVTDIRLSVVMRVILCGNTRREGGDNSRHRKLSFPPHGDHAVFACTATLWKELLR